MIEWQPAETAESGKLILVCTHKKNVYPTSMVRDGMALCYIGGVDEAAWRFEWLKFTKWAPLPEPPK